MGEAVKAAIEQDRLAKRRNTTMRRQQQMSEKQRQREQTLQQLLLQLRCLLRRELRWRESSSGCQTGGLRLNSFQRRLLSPPSTILLPPLSLASPPSHCPPPFPEGSLTQRIQVRV